MLAQKTFPAESIAAARAEAAAAVAAFDALPPSPERDALEPLLFGNLLLALEARFVHRQRGLERKGDNPLRAVRQRCEAITAGEAVAPLTRDAFVTEAEAYLDELQARFSG